MENKEKWKIVKNTLGYFCKDKWKNIVGAIFVAVSLVVGTTIVVHPAISELAGLAVAQTNTLWNSVADAAKGDGLASGIMAQATYLWNGVSFDRLKSGPTADGQAVTGILANTPLVLNTAGTYDRIRGGLTADTNVGTGLLDNGNLIFNSTTWDRQRTASGDALAITGITAVGNMVWNGTTFDRWRSASATTNTATTSLGSGQMSLLSTWTQLNTTAASATAATTSKTAGGGTVRHVVTGVTMCGFDTAVDLVNRLVNLRDGASGAGTILRTWFIGLATASVSKCENVTGLNITGTANTAMTLEFVNAPAGATQSQTVTLTGYSTP